MPEACSTDVSPAAGRRIFHRDVIRVDNSEPDRIRPPRPRTLAPESTSESVSARF
jgi:hypothetical protein